MVAISRVRNTIDPFWKFMSRPTLIDFLVAVSLGSVFTPIVASLVRDIIMPVLSLWSSRRIKDSFLVIKNGEGRDFETVEQARDAGAVVVAYGVFIEAIAIFILQALAVYVIVRATHQKTSS